MAGPTNPRVTVELEPGADPIRGSIQQADGRRQPFWGWLELIEELRRVAGGESGGPAQIHPGQDARLFPGAQAPGSGAGRGRRRRRK